MSETNDDYDFSHVAHGPDGDQMTKLRQNVQEMVRAQVDLKSAEAQVEAAKKYLAEYRDKIVPDNMRVMGLTGKVELDGCVVSSGDVLEGSLPKDPVEKAWAVAWLDANGGGPLVKREITITLPRDAASIEARIVSSIRKHFPEDKHPGLTITTDTTVHHASLKSHALEYLRKGLKVPLAQLGLILLKRAKVVASK